MSATLIIIIVIAVLFILLAVAMKIISDQIKETKKLKAELETQQQNLITLYKHAQEIAEIEKDKNRTDQIIALPRPHRGGRGRIVPRTR